MQKKPSNRPQVRDIWLVDFRFEDSNVTKARPAIIIDDSPEEAVVQFLSVKVTSQNARNVDGSKDSVGPADRYDVPLFDWQDEGLRKPSIARVGKQQLLKIKDLKHKLGIVTERDWRNINKVYIEYATELAQLASKNLGR